MNSTTVEMPSGTLAIPLSECVGHYYIVYASEINHRVLATCIDSTPEDRPKRMRIQQCMEHGGDVLMPHQYEVIEKDPQWED